MNFNPIWPGHYAMPYFNLISVAHGTLSLIVAATNEESKSDSATKPGVEAEIDDSAAKTGAEAENDKVADEGGDSIGVDEGVHCPVCIFVECAA